MRFKDLIVAEWVQEFFNDFNKLMQYLVSSLIHLVIVSSNEPMSKTTDFMFIIKWMLMQLIQSLYFAKLFILAHVSIKASNVFAKKFQEW